MLLLRQITLTSLLAISLSITTQSKAQNLEECAEFLPGGHTYEVVIKLEISKKLQEPKFAGEFSVKGGTDATSDFDISAFVKCAGPLIKNEAGIQK